MSRSALAFVMLFVALAAVLLFSAQRDSDRENAESAVLGDHIVLVSCSHSDVAEVDAAVQGFRDAGFDVTSDAARVMERLNEKDSSVSVLTVTRQSAGDLPQGLYQALYDRGVVLVGLDIAMRELSRYVFGYELSTGMLPYTPGMPVFSMMRSSCGASGRTSDWLRSWPGLAELAISRGRDRCER